MTTIFDKSKEELNRNRWPEDRESENLGKDLEKDLLRKDPPKLPEVSIPELVRHYTELSKYNFGVDDDMYPLGSCTMKYNPKSNENYAREKEFTNIHPLIDQDLAQGNLRLMYDLGEMLKQIGGLDGVSLQPAAGAHGELTGMLMIRKYHEKNDELDKRKKILLPDSAHGTNPASANVAGFKVEEIESNEYGMVDIEALKNHVGEDTAGIMLTVPNTLGIFEKDILKVSEIVHEAGGLCYFDGANLNAFLGRVRPGDMGMDIVHYNLHKTFSTPHGGGGPGSGPVAVEKKLIPFLPVPRVQKVGDKFELNSDYPESIGKVSGFMGHFGVMVKAFAYILALGDEGLRSVSGNAVLNANYLKEKLKEVYELPYDMICKHEFVLSGEGLGDDVKTVDVAKRLLDYGFHPPTVYFPLIVKEAMMIEPTETESKERLDSFVEAMKEIEREARTNPELMHKAPVETPVGRLDETRAAREPVLRWEEGQ